MKYINSILTAMLLAVPFQANASVCGTDVNTSNGFDSRFSEYKLDGGSSGSSSGSSSNGSSGSNDEEPAPDIETHPSFDFHDAEFKIVSTGEKTTNVPPGANIDFSIEVENVDDFEPEHDVYICAWLSDGRKVDDDPERVGCDKFDDDELYPGGDVDADEDFFAPTEPGTYNILACAHYNQGKDDFDEAWACDNNEQKFTVVEPIIEPDPTTTTSTGKSWDQMTPDEQAAIISIFTNYLLDD